MVDLITRTCTCFDIRSKFQLSAPLLHPSPSSCFCRTLTSKECKHGMPSMWQCTFAVPLSSDSERPCKGGSIPDFEACLRNHSDHFRCIP